MSTPVRVVVDARLVPGISGGIETVVCGLAEGIIERADPTLDVSFVAFSGMTDWLPEVLRSSDMLLEVPPPTLVGGLVTKGRGVVRLASHRAGMSVPERIAVPSDREIDRLDPDVVHYPFQRLALPKAPFIYHPHDLQHLHLPQFFSAVERTRRDSAYQKMFSHAATVSVGTRWVKQDVVNHFDVEPSLISVVAMAPPDEVVTPTASAIAAVSPLLPERYLLYPAANWPHKNHAALLRATALLRDEGLRVQLVLTGPISDSHPDPRTIAYQAGVSDQVHVLGYRSTAELAEIYCRASGVVVPTLFEAASFPIWEAFRHELPVACSAVTSLPEQVGDAALLFDPRDDDSIAQAVRVLWTDDAACRSLGVAGLARVEQLTWRRTAERFAAHYRRVAGRELSERDQSLVADDSFEPTRSNS